MDPATPLFWADKLAVQVKEREFQLQRGITVYRTESGLGASGIPHIGSSGDVLRAYAVALGLQELGLDGRLVAYADDRDGLRKVPLGFPDSLQQHIGKPVTDIPDPFACHDSYGAHMRSMLEEAVTELGVKAAFHSATADYKAGLFNKEIETILLNRERIGRIIKEMVGQETFTEQYPYWPLCASCGRIYTTRITALHLSEHTFSYACDQEFKGKNSNSGEPVLVNGCGHTGEASYFNGTGKLAWKVEFTARWKALGILFEPIGKDIAESVRVNDRICREVLGWEPPLHAQYEMFISRSGKKISKSVGNVFTPQDWLRFGSRPSLRLLMYKRFTGTRPVEPVDIPKFCDEADELSLLYFGKKAASNEKEAAHLKRLFEYIHLLHPPAQPGLAIPYQTLLNILQALPSNRTPAMVRSLLEGTGHLPAQLTSEQEQDFQRRVVQATAWLDAMGRQDRQPAPLSPEQRQGILDFAASLDVARTSDDIQAAAFSVAKALDIPAAQLFKALYQTLLGVDRGPRIGTLIPLLGQDRARELLIRAGKPA